ncbi:hypothetical cytosolic protein [Coxiella burnetii CbuK_Q154]|nr:hypothetical cytosolic protein [Coxiella burnetii CbuK_Q154]
MLNGAAANQ